MTNEEKCQWATTTPDGSPFCGKLAMPVTTECAECVDNPAHEQEISNLQLDVQTTIVLSDSIGITPARYGELLKICDALIKRQINPTTTYEEATAQFNEKLSEVLRTLQPGEAAVLGALVVLSLKQLYLGAHTTKPRPEMQIKVVSPEEYEKLTGRKLDVNQGCGNEDETRYEPQGNENWLGDGENRDVV